MRTAIAAYGGYALQDVATPSDPKSAVSSTPAQPAVTNGPTPATGTAAAYRFSGMPSHIKNAVRMIQPFYSENSTVDKARAFWEAFERATVGLDESLRLSAFREWLKGKPGEEWWMYSRIEDFETLRKCGVTSSKDFVTKRSASTHACVTSILSGLRNKEWKTALSTAMVNSIQQAVSVLLYKNMHIPVEDDADFADVVASTSKNAAEGTLLSQMMQMLQANQNLILQQQRELAQSPRSPRRSNYAAAAFENAAPPTQAPSYPQGTPASVPQGSVRGIRQGPDMYTQDGRTVCGRCHLLGCSRINCRRANATCPHCKARGRVGPECEAPQRGNGNGGGNYSQNRRPGGSRSCWACNSPDHYAVQCPTLKAFMQSTAPNAPAGATGQGPTSAQQ
ncbi:hypothetical protein PF005_g10849 [Phytophthora fragariae]|uniref:CCHC-type domain-containing protein n=2 Tax=Phytophthora fragariae TaxID=53985 RepID=A0A6A3ZAY2_9STRA|nr:hypothetical protein PF005_g10849 [Phytophthora fragariae]KAE9232553.1 hypothetical protein PF004_g9881 [Phytophthora fragariae]KAE9233524.1 hypothetical protein PF002_g12059 [Phytophthora fragariae]